MKNKFEEIEVSIDATGVCEIILNRPEAANAITIPLVKELLDIAIKCESGAPVRALVLQGEGSIFCAGGDLDWMKEQIFSDRKTRIKEATKLANLLNQNKL